MALHASEEESIEALKKWWGDNGTMIMTVVVSVAVIWGGWSFWQNSRIGTANAASDLYEEILSLSLVEPGTAVAAADREKIVQLTRQLQTEYDTSGYAMYAALFAAQQGVGANDLDLAEDQLRWVLDNAQDGLFSRTDEGLLLTANLRLARVILAKGEAQRALDLIDSIDPKTFEADFAELRGDIYVALGQLIDARDAYTTASQAGSSSTFLQMKLDELANDDEP